MVRAVIFDLNGVLIASEYLSDRFEKAYGVPCAEFIAALKEVMAQVRKPDAPDAFSLWKPHLDRWGVTLSEERFFGFWFSGETVVAEALRFIEELRAQDLMVFILSNNFRERTTYYRTNFPEIFERINRAYFSWETGYVKPSREGLERILEENGLQPSEVVYFDDSEENIELAREIGIDGQLWESPESARAYIDRKRSLLS